MLGLNRAQQVRVQAQSFHNGGSDLTGLDQIVKRGSLVLRVRDNQQNVAVVVGKAAMLGNFGGPARINDANIGSDDDVWSPGIGKWIVELQGERRAGKKLPLPKQAFIGSQRCDALAVWL